MWVSRRNIWDVSAIPSEIKREWYVCMYVLGDFKGAYVKVHAPRGPRREKMNELWGTNCWISFKAWFRFTKKNSYLIGPHISGDKTIIAWGSLAFVVFQRHKKIGWIYEFATIMLTTERCELWCGLAKARLSVFKCLLLLNLCSSFDCEGTTKIYLLFRQR
jgi:hypothetical protein